MLETMPNYDPIEDTEIIKSISRPDFDLDDYCHLAQEDGALRDEIIRQMVHNPNIKVYYHCFCIVEKCCQEKPDLFYRYWQQFETLLEHANSYHRDFGLILIALLTRADKENRMENILPQYLQHACDPKFMTARCCLRNSRVIIQAMPKLQEEIIVSLLKAENNNPYTDSQKALLKFDLLEIILQVYNESFLEDHLREYVILAMNSESPKTRKKAKEMASHFNLVLDNPKAASL